MRQNFGRSVRKRSYLWRSNRKWHLGRKQKTQQTFTVFQFIILLVLKISVSQNKRRCSSLTFKVDKIVYTPAHPCQHAQALSEWNSCNLMVTMLTIKWPNDYFYLSVATTIVFQPTWQMVQLQWLQYKHHNQVLRTTESRVDSDDKNLVWDCRRRLWLIPC